MQCSVSWWNVPNWRRAGECYLWPRYVSEATVAPAQCCIHYRNLPCVRECYLWSQNVSEAKVAPTQCCVSYRNVLNWKRVGECYLWPQNVFEAKVSPAQRSQSGFTLWNVLGNATSEECVRGTSSSSALLVICSRCYQMKLRWRMPPQATKSVWHKKSSSSLSRITVNTLPNGYVDKCYLLPWNVSKSRVAPAQFWVLLSKQLWMRWEILSLVTACVRSKSGSSATLCWLPRRCQIRCPRLG